MKIYHVKSGFAEVAQVYTVAIVLIVVLVFRFATKAQSPDNEPQLVARPTATAITLRGMSSGGTLALNKVRGYLYEGKAVSAWVVVTNQPGETASVVAERIAAALKAQGCGVNIEQTNGVATLILPGGDPILAGWLIGGTDRGFGIPEPPKAVTAFYDAAAGKVTVHWENPPGGYDSIRVYCGDSFALVGQLPGNVETATLSLWSSLQHEPFYVLVVGLKNGMPSPAAPLLLDKGRQKVLINVPFWQGIAPGFEAWTYNTAAATSQFDDCAVTDRKLIGLISTEGGAIYQRIRIRSQASAGVMRRFLGLKSGHAYRVSARVCVIEPEQRDWAFSVHAAADQAGRTPLTQAQLAGVAQLPTGAKGITAAQIARFDSTRHVAGQWVTVSSGDKRADNVSGDIVLPEGSDSITIWFRVQGNDAGDVTVGVDSLTIEDLGKK